MTPTTEDRAEFKQAELQRWNDGECAGRVAEAVAAERARIVAAVEALSGNLIVRRDHNSHPYAVSYCWRPWSTGPTLLAALRAAVAARNEVV